MATQNDLAKYAGVSAGTVSNVVSGTTRVSEKTRRKVEEAIQALNYRPNLIARSLKTQRTHTIGLVVPDITIPFFPRLIRAAEAACRERGYFLVVLDSQENHELELDMLALLRQRVDGILLATSGDGDWTEAVSSQVLSGPPIVCVDRVPGKLNVDSVCLDDRRAAEMSISHLVSMGHREIAVITGPLTLKNEQERLRGYQHALQMAGIRPKNSLVWNAGFQENEIEAICQRNLLRSQRPSALLATNGVTGLVALKSIYAIGLSVPNDIAFVTFDEIAPDTVFRPQITSVIQPTHEIGFRAVELLLERILKKEEERPRSRIRLDGALVVRESSRRYGVSE